MLQCGEIIETIAWEERYIHLEIPLSGVYTCGECFHVRKVYYC